MRVRRDGNRLDRIKIFEFFRILPWDMRFAVPDSQKERRFHISIIITLSQRQIFEDGRSMLEGLQIRQWFLRHLRDIDRDTWRCCEECHPDWDKPSQRQKKGILLFISIYCISCYRISNYTLFLIGHCNNITVNCTGGGVGGGGWPPMTTFAARARPPRFQPRRFHDFFLWSLIFWHQVYENRTSRYGVTWPVATKGQPKKWDFFFFFFFFFIFIVCFKRICSQAVKIYLHTYAINACMQFPFIILMEWCYKRQYTDKTLFEYARELRKWCSHFHILKLLYPSIFCWYFIYFVSETYHSFRSQITSA